MMKLFGSRNEESTVGIVDVGNGSMGVSFVRLDRRGQPEILFSSRTRLKMRDSLSDDVLRGELSRELPGAFEALRKAAARSPRKMSHLLFLLSAPWMRVSSIRTLRFSRSAPFRVTEDLLERMLADEMRLAKREKEDEGFSVIERTVVGLRLNGYQVSSLPPSSVHTAEVTFFTASGADNVLHTLLEASDEAFPGVDRSFHSAPLAAYHGFAALYPSLLSYLFINVAGEMTEMLHVEGGVPVAFGTFPAGRNILFRTLEASGMPVHEALSALELAQEGSSHWSETLSSTLRVVGDEWRRGFREAASALIPSGAFPASLFVLSDMRVDEWFAELVRGEEFLTVSRGSAPAVKTLPPSAFDRALRMKDGAPDSLVFLAALFADARFDEHKAIDLLSTKIPLGIPSRVTLSA